MNIHIINIIMTVINIDIMNNNEINNKNDNMLDNDITINE